jgi:hypothetical protein
VVVSESNIYKFVIYKFIIFLEIEIFSLRHSACFCPGPGPIQWLAMRQGVVEEGLASAGPLSSANASGAGWLHGPIIPG